MSSCIFCDIIAGRVDAELVFEDERAVAFRDINPQAPVHLLVIPRKHIESLAQAEDEDADLLGHLLLVGARLAREQGMAGDGYRAVFNTNAAAGQTVYHIHLHILGGRSLKWPPG